ncbi:endonuclease domain-containing protein [Phenylobacterium sp. J367]|nr:endonuclease domain-containing protein [Phenylobacterium sp. J367]
MTEPEVMLWSRLRKRNPVWPVFRRQHAIGPYILDFYCPAAALAVEVDGAGHGEGAQIAHDERRDAWLGRRGITVYRVWASSVFQDVDEVADQARHLADELIAGRGVRPLRQPLFGG